MPPTEDMCSHEDEAILLPVSNIQRLVNAVTTMLTNGIINNASHDVLDPIDPYSDIPMPYLPNLRDLLRRTTGTDDLASVTEVKLRVISREMGLQHLSVHTPNLRELTLDGSVVSSLRDLGCRLHSLKVLKVNRCKLRCLDGLNGLRSIEKLYAANNKLTDLTACTSLEFVRHIDVGGNRIEDINVIGFLVLCANLKDLVLDENFGVSNIPSYRDNVKRCIPHLRSLDGIEYADYPEINEPNNDIPQAQNVSKLPAINSKPLSASSSSSISTNPMNNSCYTVSFTPKVLSPRNNKNNEQSPSTSAGGCTAANVQVNTRMLPQI